MSTISPTHATSRPAVDNQRWASFFSDLLPTAALVGPALVLVGALCVSAGVQMLPDDLDWISQPEGMFNMFAVPFLFASWIVVGRTIARRAPRTGIAVTLLGALAAAGWTFPMSFRLFSADMLLNDFDANALNAAWEGEATVYTAIVFVFMSLMHFVVAIIAGVAVLRTKVAPAWAGIALIAFVPFFVTAQAAYVAIEVTYPLSAACLLAGVAGVVRSNADDAR